MPFSGPKTLPNRRRGNEFAPGSGLRERIQSLRPGAGTVFAPPDRPSQGPGIPADLHRRPVRPGTCDLEIAGNGQSEPGSDEGIHELSESPEVTEAPGLPELPANGPAFVTNPIPAATGPGLRGLPGEHQAYPPGLREFQRGAPGLPPGWGSEGWCRIRWRTTGGPVLPARRGWKVRNGSPVRDTFCFRRADEVRVRFSRDDRAGSR